MWMQTRNVGDLQQSNKENTSKSPLLPSGELQRRDVRKRQYQYQNIGNNGRDSISVEELDRIYCTFVLVWL